MVMDLDPDSDQVTDIFLVTNPDKLTRVRLEDGPTEADGAEPADGA
jgi:RNA polymerase sigma-70 factor (ECF subfamily)